MNNNLVRGFALVAGSTVVQKIIGIVALTVYVRLLTPQELSLIVVFNLIAQLAIVIFGGGAIPYIIKRTPSLIARKENDAIIVIAQKCFGLAWVSAILMVAILYSFKDSVTKFPILDSINDVGWLTLLLGMACQCVSNTQISLLTTLKKHKELAFINILRAIVAPVLVVAGYLNFGVQGIIYGLAINSIIIFLYSRLEVRRHIKIKLLGFNFFFLDLYKKTWPYYIEGFLMFFRRQGDQVIVAGFLGDESLGIYFFAKRLVEMLSGVVASIDRLISTEISYRFEDSKEKAREFGRDLFKLTYYFAPILALLLICVTPVYINIISGGAYSMAYWVIIILSFNFITYLVRGIVISRMVFVCCHTEARLKLTIAEVVMLLPLMTYMAINYGLEGVAVTPIITSIITSIFGLQMLKKELDFNAPMMPLISSSIAFLISLATLIFIGFDLQTPLSKTAFTCIILFVIYFIFLVNMTSRQDFDAIIMKVVPKEFRSYTMKIIYTVRVVR